MHNSVHGKNIRTLTRTAESFAPAKNGRQCISSTASHNILHAEPWRRGTILRDGFHFLTPCTFLQIYFEIRNMVPRRHGLGVSIRLLTGQPITQITLHSDWVRQARGNMRLNALLLLLSGFLFAGCTTTSLTNLTPSEQTRNANGLYPFELLWNSNQQSVRSQTIKPMVVIGFDTYPMLPAPVIKNRWETLVPIAATNKVVNYRFKVDYEYNSIPIPRMSSKMSTPYQLHIQDGK